MIYKTLGLDVIYSALETKGFVEKETSPVQVYIISIGTEIESLNLVTKLRRKGVSADIEMDRQKLRKSLEYATKQGIPFVIVIGEDEIKIGKVKIRNMEIGSEEEINIDDVELFFT